MIKTEYLGFVLDTAERMYSTGEYFVCYIRKERKPTNNIVTAEGRNIEAACASAQKKIQRAERPK